MSARNIWYPSESLVNDLPASHSQSTVSGFRSSAGDRIVVEASKSVGNTVTATARPRITRRTTLTVDTNISRNDTNSSEKTDTDQCGRGMPPTTYSTIEDSGSRASVKSSLSDLMQRSERVPTKDIDFYGWLTDEPLLHWRRVFLPKLEHASNKNTRDNNLRTRRQHSEEYVFHHYKDVSEYMKYYRKHCMLTSISAPSLRHSQHKKTNHKSKENAIREETETRPPTRAVFRTTDNSRLERPNQLTAASPTNHETPQQLQLSPHNSKLAELESRLNLRASVMPPSKPFSFIPRPTPPSIVNRESASIILYASNSIEKHKEDSDISTTQNKETVVKSSTSTTESVELPPINSCNHGSSGSSISLANYLHIRSHQGRLMLPSDPLVGAEGELEERYLHNDDSESSLVSTSIHQSSTRLDTHSGDEGPPPIVEESWMYPYPHFQAPSPSHYDRMTREQLLSSKAHALGLLSKNWTKTKRSGSVKISDETQCDPSASPMARIKSSPAGRASKELHSNVGFTPILEDANEIPSKHDAQQNKMKRSSKAAQAEEVDTIHNRTKTAATRIDRNHTTSTQNRPIHTSQGNKPHQHRAPRNAGHSQQQARRHCIALTSKLSHPNRQRSGIHRSRQSSSSYIGQINDRLQGILKVQQGSPTVSQNSMVTS